VVPVIVLVLKPPVAAKVVVSAIRVRLLSLYPCRVYKVHFRLFVNYVTFFYERSFENYNPGMGRHFAARSFQFPCLAPPAITIPS